MDSGFIFVKKKTKEYLSSVTPPSEALFGNL